MKIKFITLALIASTVNLLGSHSPYRCKMSGNQLETDVIVIGGGAAGCVVMSELSAKGRFSVLGIEGGLNLTSDPAIEAVGLPALLLAAASVVTSKKCTPQVPASSSIKTGPTLLGS